MTLLFFRLPSDEAAHALVRRLGGIGVTGTTGLRHNQSFVAVQSERGILIPTVVALLPAAVPVNGEHLPNPLPEDNPFFDEQL